MHRNILDRAEKIALLFTYDRDYMVINQGKLYWMIDAYTLSNKYPYPNQYILIVLDVV